MNGRIAIVGGGVIGLSVAWRLAQSGWQVEVFDKAQVGQEASWAAAGMLAPGGEVDGDSPLAQLAVESRQLFRNFVPSLEAESGVSIDMQEAGALDLAYSNDQLNQLHQKAMVQSAIGIGSRMLSPKQIETFWPRVRREGLAGARFYPGDGIVNPREMVAALKIAARARGVEVHEDRAVTAVHVGDGYSDVTAGDFDLRFQAVVIALGAWSSALPVSGVPPLPEAYPVKGHLIGYRQPDQTCSTIIRHGHTYLLQRANGLLVVGASVEHAGFDRTVNPETAEVLAREAAQVFPHLAETTPSQVWIGFRPGSEQLRVGPWHSPRLQLAYGHYRNGILLAPVTADRITASINASLRKQ